MRFSGKYTVDSGGETFSAGLIWNWGVSSGDFM